MADIIDVGRGSHKQVLMSGTPTAYVILKDGTSDDIGKTGWLQIDFRLHEQEKNGIIQCFREVNHIYAFGHDPESSGFSVTYLVFLGRDCMKKWEFNDAGVFKKFVDAYLKHRLSQSKKVVEITYGQSAHKGLLLGFDMAVADAEMHTVTVTFSGKCVGH